MPGLMVVLLGCMLILPACAGFHHGWTWSQAVNSYNLVTGDEHNFGDRRVKYNRGFHRHSQLDAFLASRGNPALIYEYYSPEKCRGIRLFYPAVDSVYVFEEPHKNNLRSVLKEARKMDDYERLTYERMKEKKY